ncbi:MAG: AMP-dependent synthetase/ligase [Rubrobacteraceae bacterium]
MQREATRREAGELKETGSLVEAVFRNAGPRGRKPALCWKAGESWTSLSYEGLRGRIENFAAGLASLGVEAGSRVALVSRNRVEWPISDLAIQSLGAMTVPIYPTLETAQIEYILNNSGACVAIVEDRDLLEKASSLRYRVTALRHIVVMSGDAGSGEDDVRWFNGVERTGEYSQLEDWEARWRAIGREDVATVVYTSGTTGMPKGVVLTHGNILSNLEGTLEALPVRTEDVFLSFLPLSHIFERTSSQFLALTLGATTYYAESFEKVPENLREVRPTVALSVPRLYEKVYDRVRAQAAEGSALRRRLFEDAVGSGRKAYAIERDGGEVGPVLRARLALYDRLIFRKLRDALGGQVRFFVSGGAKLGTEVGEFFYAAGIRVVEGYGLTETSPVVTCNRLGRLRFGTVGLPFRGTEVRTSPEGEIQVKGPGVMRGYLDNEEATAEAFTEDGWYRTGDIGEFDEAGYLKITDRSKNLIVLSTGKNVAPQPIETALVTTPHVSQSILLGDGRKYVSALIVPDYDAVRRELGTAAKDEELSEDDGVRDLIQKDLEAATAGFAAYERPKKFALLARELSHENGELTPTLKVKMRVVRKRYGGVIEKLYS